MFAKMEPSNFFQDVREMMASRLAICGDGAVGDRDQGLSGIRPQETGQTPHPNHPILHETKVLKLFH